MPRLDTLEDTWIFVALILPDLLLSLLDLLFLESCKLLESKSNLFQFEVCLGSLTLVILVGEVDVLAKLD